MTTITNAYLNALLADATYALEEDGLQNISGTPLTSRLNLRMTPTLAKYIGDNYTVVTHIETGDVLGSGFDATVWKDNATGKLTVSIQGTKGLQDFLTDGGDGNDLIAGGTGSNTIRGGAGDDYISGSGTMTVPQRSRPGDLWTPLAGKTSLYASSTWGVFIDTNAVVGSVAQWSGMVDTGTGTDSNYIDGGAGDDTIIAGHGSDHILGGLGKDMITGLEGNDILEGGEGDDTIWADGIVVPGFFSSVAPDQQGVDFVDGGDGNDKILGGGKADVLYGGAGNDVVFGDGGGRTDSIYFLDAQYHGADYLDGEDGDDVLWGDNQLGGGGGNDTTLSAINTTNLIADNYYFTRARG